jgi:hypothetical protein
MTEIRVQKDNSLVETQNEPKTNPKRYKVGLTGKLGQEYSHSSDWVHGIGVLDQNKGEIV